MKNKLTLSLSAVSMFFLLLPSVQYFFRPLPEGKLYGYVDKRLTGSDASVTGWFRRDIQKQWASAFDENIGFKNILVRSFNDLSFRLFSEMPRLRLYSTPEHGLYSQMSIDSLNNDFVNKQQLLDRYTDLSEKLMSLQQLLASSGKRFEVVISSSKPYVHPDSLGTRFLSNTDQDAIAGNVHLGKVLAARGVNVIDSGPLLRQFYESTSIETHPYSGVHWNYYAGCIVTQKLFADAKETISEIPVLSCGEPIYKQPIMDDVDGLLLLNTITNVGIDHPSPYPMPSANFFGTYKPKILIVGDSFTGQILFSMKDANIYSRLVTSNYFRTREVHRQQPDWSMDSAPPSLSEQEVQAAVMADALDSDLIVLQFVDYNASRLGYGFVESMLGHLEKISNAAELKITSTTGAYERESDGVNWWHWVEKKVVFSMERFSLNSGSKKTHIRMILGTRGRQTLTLSVMARNGERQQIQIDGDGVSRQLYDSVVSFAPEEIVQLSIESSGKPSALGPRDPRTITFIVSNLKLGAN